MFNNVFLTTAAIGSLLLGVAQADIWTPTEVQYQILNAPNFTPENQNGLHSNPLWQMLGTTWGANDGVQWSINGGSFTNTDFDLNVGDDIQFTFQMYKTLWGTHSYDAIQVWMNNNVLDLYDYDIINANKGNENNMWVFNKDKIASEAGRYENEISYYHNYSALDYDADGFSSTDEGKLANWNRYYADSSKYFITDKITISDASAFDILARVTCSDDLGGTSVGSYPDLPSDGDWNKFTKTQYYWQGESELNHFTVSDVPEPSVVSLLGFGLLGLAFFRRKKK